MSQHIVEHLSSMLHDVTMRREILVPGKHGTSYLMLSLKEAEIKVEYTPVTIYQGHNATKQLKYKCEIPTVMVHAGQINKTTKLPLTTYE